MTNLKPHKILFFFTLLIVSTQSTFALTINSARPITHTISVQPIIVADNNGNNQANYFGTSTQQSSIESFINQIWSQAGINVNFLAPNRWNNSFANWGAGGVRPTSDLSAIISTGTAAGATNTDSKIINMFFVNTSAGFSHGSSYSTSGLALLNSNGITQFVGTDLLSLPSGTEIIAGVVAHEIGHNLGLAHTASSGAANLMSSNASTSQLTSNQISTSLSSTFSRVTQASPIPDPRNLLTFNTGNNSDIIWRNQITGSLLMYKMSGGSVTNIIPLAQLPDLNLTVAGTGDFNADGNLDIILRHGITGENKILLMNGTNIVTTSTINIEADQNLKIVGTGDFNGDGKDDILWRNAATGDNWMYLMNGAFITASVKINTVPSLNWSVADTGDFNGDGKDDILWRHSTNGRVWIYHMNGASILSSNHVSFSGLDWEIQKTGDFNGDGKADILWRNNVHGRVWAFIMNGSTISTSAHVSFTGLDWDIVAVNDYNGDGKADIFWRNNVTGLNWMYTMNGSSILNQASVNHEADLNWKVIE